MKILLTGASSSPGYKTLVELAGKGYRVYGVYNTHPVEYSGASVETFRLDITDHSRVSQVFYEIKPDIVVHMAALGDVNRCEEDKELAWRVNVEATRHLSKLSSRTGSKLLYLSTDYVFYGDRGMYREDDTPNPINYYGLTKLLGEEAVRSSLDDYVIVRTSAVYGLGMGRTNFGKFLINALSQGRRVKAIVDQWLSPTLNTLLAKAVAEIIEKSLQGTLHVAGERISRYEFALKVAEKFGFDKTLIEPARMEEFNWIAPRPRDSSLDTSRAQGLLSTKFYSLSYSLEVFYNEWRKEMRIGA